jgi:hypothetical protein
MERLTNRWSSPPGFLLFIATAFCRGPSVAVTGRLLNSMLSAPNHAEADC